MVSNQPSLWEQRVRIAVQHLVWRWPMRAATWLGQKLYDRTGPALAIGAVLLLPVVATAVLKFGAVAAWWGAPLAVALNNEKIAEENVSVIRAEIEEHNRLRQEFNARDAWREDGRRLERELKQQQRFVPSWLQPRAPAQLFAASAHGWRLVYDANHLLFGSVYSALIAFYLVLGVASGWKGSQRWWRARWKKSIGAQSAEKLLLGLDESGRAHFLEQEERNRHLLIAGTTGAGKTEALKLLTRHDIAHGRGLVFIDMKGDRGLAEALSNACVEAGRGDDFLHFTFEPAPCHTYNALASGDALAKRDRLLSACTWSTEVFYKNEAKAALGRVLAALAPRGAVTFDDLYHAFDEREAYWQVAQWAAPEDRSKFERDLAGWQAFWRNLSGLRANLHEFLQLRDRLSVAHGDIDFREVHARNRVVYFELNSQMRKEAATSVARLVLEDLKHLSGSLAAGPAIARKPFSIYVDEARNAVYEGFVGFISQCRSAGIGLVLASQSPLDFDGETPGVTLSVVQNSATKLIFCQRDPESAQLCAEMGGTTDTIKRTSQVVDDGFIFGPTATGAMSEREVKEFRVHPDAIKALGTGRAFLIKGDAHALLRVQHRPTTGRSELSLKLPRKWHPGDRERFGQAAPSVDLASAVASAFDADISWREAR